MGCTTCTGGKIVLSGRTKSFALHQSIFYEEYFDGRNPDSSFKILIRGDL